MFSRFFKKKPAPQSPYPFSESVREVAGTEATARKRGLDARLQELENSGRPLSGDQQAELERIRVEIADLLQVEAAPAHIGQLPVAAGDAAGDFAGWVTQGPSTARILLIEDDPDMNDLLDFMLQHNRFEAIRFNDGKKAREWILSQGPPDLVSLDIMLPHFDGLELIATIRAQAGWEAVPIIILSSKSDEPTVQRALRLGANEYLPKPFQPEDYLTRIKRLLAAR